MRELELYERFLTSQGKSSQTTISYKYWVTKFIEFVNKQYNEITMFDIQAFVEYKLSSGNKASSVNIAIPAINSFYAFCNDFDLFKNEFRYKQVNDKGKQERLNNRDFLTPKQFMAFIEINELYFRSHLNFTNARRWVVMYLMLFCGLRKSEIADILEHNIEYMEDQHIYHIHIEHGKGDKPRESYIHERFKEPYELYLSIKRKEGFDCQNFICTLENKPLYPTALNETVNWLTKNAGLDLNLCPHRLRDAAADYCLSLGYDIATVSKILGHSNVNTTTRRYLHGHDDMQREAAVGMASVMSV